MKNALFIKKHVKTRFFGFFKIVKKSQKWPVLGGQNGFWAHNRRILNSSGTRLNMRLFEKTQIRLLRAQNFFRAKKCDPGLLLVNPPLLGSKKWEVLKNLKKHHFWVFFAVFYPFFVFFWKFRKITKSSFFVFFGEKFIKFYVFKKIIL